MIRYVFRQALPGSRVTEPVMKVIGIPSVFTPSAFHTTSHLFTPLHTPSHPFTSLHILSILLTLVHPYRIFSSFYWSPIPVSVPVPSSLTCSCSCPLILALTSIGSQVVRYSLVLTIFSITCSIVHVLHILSFSFFCS